MMKVSEIIKGLQEDMDKRGDFYIKEFTIEDEEGFMGRKMISKTRKDKNGQSLKMNQKEFMEYIQREKLKETHEN